MAAVAISHALLVLVGDPAEGTPAAEIEAFEREVESLMSAKDGDLKFPSPRRVRWGWMGVDDLYIMPTIIASKDRDEAERHHRNMGWRRVIFLGPLAVDDRRPPDAKSGGAKGAGKAPA